MLRIYVKTPPAPVEIVPDVALELTFDDIANVPVADASSVSDWNTFFDLPTYGSPFTSVEVVGAMVRLIGGSGITLKDELFYISGSGNEYLISVNDIGCVASAGDRAFSLCYLLASVNFPLLSIAGDYCFNECSSLTSVSLPLIVTAGEGCFLYCGMSTISLPSLTTVGESCFQYCSYLTSVSLVSLTSASAYCFDSCSSLTTINIPLENAGGYCFSACQSLATINQPLLTTIGNLCFWGCVSLTTINLQACTNLGDSVASNQVFIDITGNTITLTIPSALMTCNGGNPDGDIQTLQANNTVTIVTV